MEKLDKMIKNNPKLKSDRGEWFKPAVKDANGAVRGTGPHTVKVIGVENAVNKDYKTQKEVKGVNLLLEENGEAKKYFIPTLGPDGKFHYLIERFAQIKEGTEVVIEYQRRPGSAKGFINVQVAGEDQPASDELGEIQVGEIFPSEEPTGKVDYEEIPVVEEENETT